ncbi:unnamed protein product [Leptosia nina]|uniref:Uncharacterized protein n=1 Tax=Leptosia nina TaxID=320188 RepID=A0AAV1JTH7_9NEOP
MHHLIVLQRRSYGTIYYKKRGGVWPFTPDGAAGGAFATYALRAQQSNRYGEDLSAQRLNELPATAGARLSRLPPTNRTPSDVTGETSENSHQRSFNTFADKMKLTLVLFVVACALSLAYGDFICGSSYCKDHPCTEKVSAKSCKSPSLYRANHAGKCACCPACVTLLSEGAACKKYSKEVGETPSAICAEPLKCLKGVCTKVAPRH